jgi:hypothetical protein
MDAVPKPLADYFDATNDRDLIAMLAPFAATAVVKDDGRTMNGTAEIRQWISETSEKSRHTIAVLAAEGNEREATVIGRIAGTFAGSPIDLRFDVTVDSGRISRLEIHP